MEDKIKERWYEKNKEFEKNIYFKIYRNQRLRVNRLKKELRIEKMVLNKYFSQMEEAREEFKSNLTKQTGGDLKDTIEQVNPS